MYSSSTYTWCTVTNREVLDSLDHTVVDRIETPLGRSNQPRRVHERAITLALVKYLIALFYPCMRGKGVASYGPIYFSFFSDSGSKAIVVC